MINNNLDALREYIYFLEQSVKELERYREEIMQYLSILNNHWEDIKYNEFKEKLTYLEKIENELELYIIAVISRLKELEIKLERYLR